MIRLIVTDIDGTLVEDGHTNLNPAYYQVIRELSEYGVQFAVASGRHAVSVRQTFTPVLDCIWILSQNGAVIERGENSHVVSPLPAEWVREFWQDLSHYSEADGILDTAEQTYCPYNDTEMYHILRDEYKFNTEATGGWNCIPDGVFSMMTVYHPDSAEAFCRNSGLLERWSDRLDLVPTAKVWVDCMMKGVDKGRGLLSLCKQLGIDPKDTIAFGDNINDIPMLRAAGIGYAVDNARPEVLQAADQILPGWREDGVLKEMQRVLTAIRNDSIH